MIDLQDPRSVTDPAEYFEPWRRQGPVQWSDAHRAWVILGHAELTDAFRDGETLSADRITPLERVAAHRPQSFRKVVELLSGWMVFRDPPAHTRLRDPVRNAFTPRRVATMTDLVSDVVDDLLMEIAAPNGQPVEVEVDLRRRLAAPLPAAVIAAVMGVDPAERGRFVEWSDQLATIVFSTTPHDTPPQEAIAASAHFTAFFGELVERERSQPSGTLLTALVQGADASLDKMELIGACTLLLFAGHETTTSLVCNAVALLLERPDLASWWRAHRQSDELAVEELLRCVGPARSMMRKVATGHRRGRHTLHTGENVLLAICAANHDPSVFVAPQTVDLTRNPNPHVGFGWGLHHCVGAHLARLETRLLLRALLDRYAGWEATEPLPPVEGTILGYAQSPLHVRFTP